MKKLLTTLFVLTTLSVLGQNNYLGAKGALGLTTIYADDWTSDGLNPEPTMGFSGGLSFEHVFKNRFTASSDLIYSRKGFSTGTLYIESVNSNSISFDPVKIVFHFDYISVPLKVGITRGRKVPFYANIGVCPSYLVDATTAMDKENIWNDTKKVARYDIAGLLEIGIGYRFNKRYTLNGSLIYQHSFTSVTTSQFFAGGYMIQHGIAFGVGLKYALKEE